METPDSPDLLHEQTHESLQRVLWTTRILARARTGTGFAAPLGARVGPVEHPL